MTNCQFFAAAAGIVWSSIAMRKHVMDFARWIDKLVDMCEERAKQLRKEEHGTTR